MKVTNMAMLPIHELNHVRICLICLISLTMFLLACMPSLCVDCNLSTNFGCPDACKVAEKVGLLILMLCRMVMSANTKALLVQ